MKHLFLLMFSLALIMIFNADPAQAQFQGNNFRGDYGIMSGSQPEPGFYFAPMYARYDINKIMDRNGDEIRPDLPGDLDVNAYSFGAWYVSDFKILGATYGFIISPAFTDNVLEIPVLGVNEKVGTGFTDLYFSPLNLGWRTPRADFTAGLGITAPTGRYEPDGSNNVGLGMWCFEPYAGTTVYLDKARSWSFAATAFYEMHTTKKDTDVKVGGILTVEGGLGKSFMGGSMTVGAAYFAQWKVTHDDLGTDLIIPEEYRLGRNHVYGLGPDVTFPIATKSKLIALINVRYFWDLGARSNTDGQTLLITATFPIPSVSK